jgi:hypothetical protein
MLLKDVKSQPSDAQANKIPHDSKIIDRWIDKTTENSIFI